MRASTAKQALLSSVSLASAAICTLQPTSAADALVIKGQAAFEEAIANRYRAVLPAESMPDVMSKLKGAKACLLANPNNPTDEQLISVAGFNAKAFMDAITYARNLPGYNDGTPTPVRETICAYLELSSKKASHAHGYYNSEIGLSRVKMGTMLNTADTVYHEHTHARWHVINGDDQGTTTGDELLADTVLNEASAFARTFIAFQIKRMTTSDKREAMAINGHLKKEYPLSFETFKQLEELYGPERIKEHITRTGQLPPEIARLLIIEIMEELIDRDYGAYIKELDKTNLDVSITLDDAEVRRLLSFNGGMFGGASSWEGFTAHVVSKIPVIQLITEKPDSKKYNRPLSAVASVATALNQIINTANKDWDMSVFAGIDLTGYLFHNDATKAEFIRRDLQTLFDIAIDRSQNITGLSDAKKLDLQSYLFQVRTNVLDAPPAKNNPDATDMYPHTSTVVRVRNLFKSLSTPNPCISFAPLWGTETVTDLTKNPMTRNPAFIEHLEKLAFAAKKSLAAIKGYSPGLKSQIDEMIDEAIAAVKDSRPPNFPTTMRGLSPKQSRASCG